MEPSHGAEGDVGEAQLGGAAGDDGLPFGGEVGGDDAACGADLEGGGEGDDAGAGGVDQAVVGEAPGRAEETEGADVFEPVAKGGVAGVGPAAHDAAEAGEKRLGELGDGGLAVEDGEAGDGIVG